MNVSFLQELLTTVAEQGRALLPKSLFGYGHSEDVEELEIVAASCQESEAGVARSPLATSGARKSGVPSTNPAMVMVESPVRRAIPKSIRCATPGPVQHDVARLDVAVHHPVPRARRPARRRPPAQTRAAADVVEHAAAAHQPAERLAVDVLHDDDQPVQLGQPGVAGRRQQVVDAHAVRVPDGGQRPGLALDALLGLGVRDVRRLERDLVTEPGVVGQPDPAETAGAEPADEPEPGRAGHPGRGGQRRPGRPRHRWRAARPAWASGRGDGRRARARGAAPAAPGRRAGRVRPPQRRTAAAAAGSASGAPRRSRGASDRRTVSRDGAPTSSSDHACRGNRRR